MLQLNDVWAGYGGEPVLREINIPIPKGQTTVLIGLNGSGKSTLLKSILGLIPPSRGIITWSGIDLHSMPLKERAKKISLLESQPSITFPMSVEELLQLSARRHGQKDGVLLAAHALEAVGLEGFRSRSLTELSSGEAKRALLAHALCGNAQVIMLDEPFAHLDWRHQCELAESLKSWKIKYQSTFVLAVHELEWAVKLSDRLCVLHQGQIIKVGAPEETLSSPEVGEVFAFQSRIDENPLDGSKRLTLGRPHFHRL